MQFDLHITQDKLYFKHYAPDSGFDIAGQHYTTPIRVDNLSVLELDITFEEINEQVFQPAVYAATPPEIILIGCGQTQKFLHPAISSNLTQQKIGIEIMITPAALRTFNILKADNRSVWAWLWP